MDLRNSLAKQHGVVASDRRWKKIVKFIQASAVLNGRTKANLSDLLPIADCLWDKPEQRAAIYSEITNMVSPDLRKAVERRDAAAEMFSNLDLTSIGSADVREVSEVNGALKQMVTECEELDQDLGKIAEITNQIRSMQTAVATAVAKILGIPIA